MASAAATPDTPTPHVHEDCVASGPWNELLMDLRKLSPVGFRIDWDSVVQYGGGSRKEYPAVKLIGLRKPRKSVGHVFPPPHGLFEALLIELGSRRDEWVTLDELCEAYRITPKQIDHGVASICRMYPSVGIERRYNVGLRVVGPLPPHVERIAPK